jgi:hypothetical protein
MGALAIHTGAVVYAADRIQWYSKFNDGGFDFGAWEGTVYLFPPSGSSPVPVDRAPVELADVFAGRAA